MTRSTGGLYSVLRTRPYSSTPAQGDPVLQYSGLRGSSTPVLQPKGIRYSSTPERLKRANFHRALCAHTHIAHYARTHTSQKNSYKNASFYGSVYPCCVIERCSGLCPCVYGTVVRLAMYRSCMHAFGDAEPRSRRLSSVFCVVGSRLCDKMFDARRQLFTPPPRAPGSAAPRTGVP